MRLKRFFTGYFYTSFAALSMALQTNELLGKPSSAGYSVYLACLVFIGYNVYFLSSHIITQNWRVDTIFLSRFRWRIQSVCIILPGFLLSVFYVKPGIEIWLLLGTLFLIYLFIRLVNNKHVAKAAGWMKTIALSLIWVYVTVCLPLSFFDISFDVKAGLLLFQRFCFIFLIALFFDVRDLDKDRAMHRSTLVSNLGKYGFLRLVFVLAGASIVTIFLLFNLDFIDTWQVIVLFLSTLFATGLDLYHKKIKNRINYVILGDGCMILSTVLLFVDRISLLCCT